MAGASSAFAARSSGVVPIVSVPSSPRSLPMFRNGARELQLRVRVRAGGEQLFDDLQAGGRVERRPIGPAAAGNRVHVHRGIERGPAVPVPLARIRTLLDQIRGEIEVPVEDRQEQRADLFRIGEIEVGAAFHQVLRALDAAFASDVQQGREPAGGPVNRARLGGDLALPVVDRRPGVHVGAGRDQRLHHRGLALGGRPHQRGLSAPLFDRVDLGAVAQQGLGRIDSSGARDDHQRRLTVGVWRLDIRAGLQQRFDHLRASGDRGFRHRRGAVVVPGVHLGAGAQQTRRQIEIVLMDRPMQRGGAVGFGRVHIGAPLDQGERRGLVSGLDRIHERRGGDQQGEN